MFRRVIRCETEDDPRYRYALEVALAPQGAGLSLAAILKNPSTAAATRSDATMGKVEAWARRQGFGRVVVVNLFARRATEPVALNDLPYAVIVGPANDAAIRRSALHAGVVIAGWGNPNGLDPAAYERRIGEVLALLAGVPLYCAGPITRLGHPRHGRLWNHDCVLQPWNPERGSTARKPARRSSRAYAIANASISEKSMKSPESCP